MSIIDDLKELRGKVARLNARLTALSGEVSGSGAPADAKYILQEADGALANAQSLGALTTGLLKNTVAGAVGVLSKATENTDYAGATHASRHQSGGADPIKLDDLAAPDDTTDLDADTSKHGLLPKLPGGTDKFLRSDGTFAAPPGGSGGSSTTTGAEGSEATSGVSEGDLYFPNNSPYLKRFSGSVWVPWGPIWPLTKPVSGDYSWVNQEGATLTTTNGAMALYAPAGSGDDLRVLVKTAPSTPYVITALVCIQIWPVPYSTAGLCFRESGTGEIQVFAWKPFQSNNLGVDKYNSPTSYSGNYTAIPYLYNGTFIWLRIADNGTNRICSISNDGYTWYQVHSVGRTDFLTADQVGFYANPNQATYPVNISLISWKET